MRARRIVDLSVPLEESTQVYPGDPQLRTRVHARIETEGFNVLALSLGSQTGTHVEAPYHVDGQGAPIDRVDLARFVGPAVIVDVTGLSPRQPVTRTAIAPYAERLRAGVIALLHTGWATHYGTAAYFDHPFLDVGACEEIVARGVRTILVDAPSLDETPDAAHPVSGLPVHRLLAAVGGVIGENLCGFDAIDFEPFVVCVPLRLIGADGAPARAVALDLA